MPRIEDLGGALLSAKARAPTLAEESSPLDMTVRVLAAEDNRVNQLVLRTLLAEVGIDPYFVETGRHAVQAWMDETWDLILMDVHMPEMDGVSATREIRAHARTRPHGRTPIIMLTADVMSYRVADYHDAGADAVVGKPIQASGLLAAMAKALERSEKTDSDLAVA